MCVYASWQSRDQANCLVQLLDRQIVMTINMLNYKLEMQHGEFAFRICILNLSYDQLQGALLIGGNVIT